MLSPTIVSHKEGFQQPTLAQCCAAIKRQIYLYIFKNKFSTTRGSRFPPLSMVSQTHDYIFRNAHLTVWHVDRSASKTADPIPAEIIMMTSSNGNILRVTGHFCGEVTGEFVSQRTVTRSFDIFLDLCLNKRLIKQSRCRWFETPSRSLWHPCNAQHGKHHGY